MRAISRRTPSKPDSSDRARRVVDDDVDPGEGLQRADVAPLAADDPPFSSSDSSSHRRSRSSRRRGRPRSAACDAARMLRARRSASWRVSSSTWRISSARSWRSSSSSSRSSLLGLASARSRPGRPARARAAAARGVLVDRRLRLERSHARGRAALALSAVGIRSMRVPRRSSAAAQARLEACELGIDRRPAGRARRRSGTLRAVDHGTAAERRPRPRGHAAATRAASRISISQSPPRRGRVVSVERPAAPRDRGCFAGARLPERAGQLRGGVQSCPEMGRVGAVAAS